MSILARLPNGWFISHPDFVNQELKNGTKMRDIFDIKTPFRMDQEAAKAAKLMENDLESSSSSKRRKLNAHHHQSEDDSTERCQQFLASLTSQGLFIEKRELTPDVVLSNNSKVRQLAHDLDKASNQRVAEVGRIRILSDDDVIPKHILKHFFIPKAAKFVQETINKALIDDLVSQGKSYKLILMDPPWENKHVRRERWKTRGYASFDNEEMMTLGLERLFHPDCLVVVWCTNAERHEKAVIDWFSRWNISNITCWLWLKVTHFGEPVTAFNKGHKLPFEKVFLGSTNSELKLPENKVICSVPSALQSHKPPLIHVLCEALSTAFTDCLELYGRYLLPQWTTLGDQCLKFQSNDFYE